MNSAPQGPLDLSSGLQGFDASRPQRGTQFIAGLHSHQSTQTGGTGLRNMLCPILRIVCVGHVPLRILTRRPASADQMSIKLIFMPRHKEKYPPRRETRNHDSQEAVQEALLKAMGAKRSPAQRSPTSTHRSRGWTSNDFSWQSAQKIQRPTTGSSTSMSRMLRAQRNGGCRLDPAAQ